MFRNILLPTDGSDYSRTALQYGITIAKKLDARLIRDFEQRRQEPLAFMLENLRRSHGECGDIVLRIVVDAEVQRIA